MTAPSETRSAPSPCPLPVGQGSGAAKASAADRPVIASSPASLQNAGGMQVVGRGFEFAPPPFPLPSGEGSLTLSMVILVHGDPRQRGRVHYMFYSCPEQAISARYGYDTGNLAA